jgi:squalene-associated FAD-dependent desaturase
VSVTVLEARKWLGGATSSFARDGLTVDTGQHVFLRCCTAYRGFLDRLGVGDLVRLQPRMDIPVLAPGRPPARLRRGRLPAPLHLVPALARYPFLTVGQKLRVAMASLAMRRVDPADPAADARSFGEWLADRRQPEPTVRYLWDLFGLPTLNLPASQASLAMAAKVFRTGLLERADAADVGVAAVPLSELHAAPAERVLASLGARVRLGSKVRAVRASSKGVAGVATDEGDLEADAVVLAVPNDRVGELLPPGSCPDPGAFARLGASPIVNVHVVYDRRVMDPPFAAAVDSPVQWVFDRTGPSGLDAGQYLAVSLSGAEAVVDDPVERFRAAFVPALAELFPRANWATVRTFLVTRERAATFRQGPGTAALRPGPVTDLPGLYLAGAWTDTGWPATMEGAVRSGLAAARSALLAMGMAARLPAAPSSREVALA